MELHFQATYEDGVLRPNVPLALPERTVVDVTVSPRDEPHSADLDNDESESDEEVRPEAPSISAEEVRRILSNRGPGVGSLPVDFDRDDIYSDHD